MRILIYLVFLILVGSPVFAANGDYATDYTRIKCRVLGYRIKDTTHIRSCGKSCTYQDHEKLPLLYVDLIFKNGEIKYYAIGNYEARKEKTVDDSDYDDEDQARSWAEQYNVNETYTCYYADSDDITMEMPTDDDIITLAFAITMPIVGIFCLIPCCICGFMIMCCWWMILLIIVVCIGIIFMIVPVIFGIIILIIASVIVLGPVIVVIAIIILIVFGVYKCVVIWKERKYSDGGNDEVLSTEKKQDEEEMTMDKREVSGSLDPVKSVATNMGKEVEKSSSSSSYSPSGFTSTSSSSQDSSSDSSSSWSSSDSESSSGSSENIPSTKKEQGEKMIGVKKELSESTSSSSLNSSSDSSSSSSSSDSESSSSSTSTNLSTANKGRSDVSSISSDTMERVNIDPATGNFILAVDI